MGNRSCIWYGNIKGHKLPKFQVAENCQKVAKNWQLKVAKSYQKDNKICPKMLKVAKDVKSSPSCQNMPKGSKVAKTWQKLPKDANSCQKLWKNPKSCQNAAKVAKCGKNFQNVAKEAEFFFKVPKSCKICQKLNYQKWQNLSKAKNCQNMKTVDKKCQKLPKVVKKIL